MKNIIKFGVPIILLLGIYISGIYLFDSPSDVVVGLYNGDKKEIDTSNTLAIMYENDNGEYVESTSSNWLGDGYIFNESLSKCKNGSKIYYDSSTNKVMVEANTNDRCYVYFDVYSSPSYTTFKKLNLTLGDGTPDFSKISCSNGCQENTVGVYEMEDDLGTSYYFRGDVENNYVLFAGFYWRIIRINGDGTIRMIYDGTTSHANGEISSDRQIDSGIPYNETSIYDCAYVGYMLGINSGSSSSYAQATNNIYDSTIKKVVDAWYKNNIYDKGYNSYVADAIYCNDRSIYSGSGYGISSYSNQTIYNPHQRLWNNNNPTLLCQQENDRFSVENNVNGINTNGDLTYPVGLLTADELSVAGTRAGSGNSKFYLYNDYNFWLMTPAMSSTYQEIYSFSGMFLYASSYYTGDEENDSAVRPVISLRADLNISGDGTINNPYTVV